MRDQQILERRLDLVQEELRANEMPIEEQKEVCDITVSSHVLTHKLKAISVQPKAEKPRSMGAVPVAENSIFSGGMFSGSFRQYY